MKSKRANYVSISGLIVFLLCISWSIVGFTNNKSETQNLALRGKANKESFILGEPVKVDFEFTNESETPIVIFSGGVSVGSLKIFIGNKEEEEYKEYFSVGWGRLRGYELTLEPKKVYKYQEATILWNGKPNVSHLNEDSAKQVLKDKITTEYAFPETGVYLIKGLSSFGENATPIESEPVQITINEPVGDDLTVWNQIKGNREIALLMQVGEFNTGKDEEKAKLVRQIEQILEQFPNSIYSSYLKTNLEKFKVSEERRQKFKENPNQ